MTCFLLILMPFFLLCLLLLLLGLGLGYCVTKVLRRYRRYRRKISHGNDIEWTSTDDMTCYVENPTPTSAGRPTAQQMTKKKKRVLPGILRWNNHEYEMKSFYLTMSDGVKIAADLYLPLNPQSGPSYPCILHQSRYQRSTTLHWPFHYLVNGGRPFNLINTNYFKAFLDQGLAVISMDVRGSGASFGHMTCPWHIREQQDSFEMIDWIVAQDWSNRHIGLWGVSYEATAAFCTLAGYGEKQDKSSLIRACVPMFMIWDIYNDVARPGGILQHQFAQDWQRVNDALDQNQHRQLHLWAPLFVRGVSRASSNPLDLHQALADHKRNWRAMDDMHSGVYRDSTSSSGEFQINDIAAYRWARAAKATRAATLFYSGWYDCTARGVLQGLVVFGNTRVSAIIGPWNHGGLFHFRPDSHGSVAKFDHVEVVATFMKRHLTLSSDKDAPPQRVSVYRSEEEEDRKEKAQLGWFHFYCLGENAWNHTRYWPLSSMEHPRFYLQSDNHLRETPPPTIEGPESPKTTTASRFQVARPSRSLQGHSRWQAMIKPKKINYRGWHRATSLCFTAPPFRKPFKVVGSPVVELYLASSDTNADVFIYLVSLSPHTKEISYLTEGHFRASHSKEVDTTTTLEGRTSGEGEDLKRRVLPQSSQSNIPLHSFEAADDELLEPGEIRRVRFDLLPTSYCFKEGTQLRIYLAGQDMKHFTTLEDSQDRWITIYHQPDFSSFIELPHVVEPELEIAVDDPDVG